MDRIIQPYGAQSVLAPGQPPGVVRITSHVQLLKTPGDYGRALRRRLWLVVLVALGVTIPGAVTVARLPAIYQALAEIVIEPPRFDPAVAIILSNNSVGSIDRETSERYVPNHLAQLLSKALAERVVAEANGGPSPGSGLDPVQDVLTGLQTRRLPGTNRFKITLEGTDPERSTQLLNLLLDRFQGWVKDESFSTINNSMTFARSKLVEQRKELKQVDTSIKSLLESTPIFAPGGKNLLHEEYVALKSVLMNKKVRFDDLAHEEALAQIYPHLRPPSTNSKYAQRIAVLLEEKDRLTEQAERARRTIKNFDRDPVSRQITRMLDKIMDEIEQLQRLAADELPQRSTLVLHHSGEEIRKLEREIKSNFDRMQETMPRYQEYLSLLRDREQKEQSIAAMQDRLTQFNMVAQTQKNPVEILQRASEPGSPIRPHRPLYIALIGILGLGLGIALVCVLESLDHSVKVPEHLTAGLSLPLFGVIPRMRRLVGTQRGGHLWTPGAPESLEADAYRNLRASLLGVAGAKGPLVTLLVTSAKAGEGKSTTALNLAATCARSGERTLLVDIDLRRPSLGGVFEGAGHDVGLVDVLRGEMPWQRAIVRTDLPNLNFLPAGDPSGVPIEILGSLELRQLLTALAGQYHRVILDGPAVLGLADCRMLGRIVDAAVLVVRSGAHGLDPLRRAKEMLEQSKVTIAGVVFNDMVEDMQNWSSYGASVAVARTVVPASSTQPPRGLNAPAENAAGMVTAVPIID